MKQAEKHLLHSVVPAPFFRPSVSTFNDFPDNSQLLKANLVSENLGDHEKVGCKSTDLNLCMHFQDSSMSQCPEPPSALTPA